eukprot:5894172-Pyramimonas_sp.AAC.1
MTTPPGRPAFMVDEYGVATEASGSTALTLTANPQCEEMPMLVKEVADAEPTAEQPASSSVGTPATSDARAYMMSQDTGGILFSISEEAFSYTIHSGEQRPQDLASQERDVWECPCACRSGFRLAQLAGEALSGHL